MGNLTHDNYVRFCPFTDFFGIGAIIRTVQEQAPEKFLATLAVLGAARQTQSHFDAKFMSFWEQQSCSRSKENAL